MMRATVTAVAKVRQAVTMTVRPSRWQAQPSVKGSAVVSRRDATSLLARSEAEEGRRRSRAVFRKRSGSGETSGGWGVGKGGGEEEEGRKDRTRKSSHNQCSGTSRECIKWP